jgi:hypothetical protein
MSILHWGDDDMHYSDSSHRWIAPDDVEQSLWEAGLRAHLAQHLTTMGGPVRADEMRNQLSRRPVGTGRATAGHATSGRTARGGTARNPRRVLRLAPDVSVDSGRSLGPARSGDPDQPAA